MPESHKQNKVCKETVKLEILENINKIKTLERKELFTENHYLEEICGVTASEYDKLPKYTKIDEYAPCMRGPGDTYCFASAHLHGNLSDPLYKTIVEYSANTVTHFNHTKIHWGICPKRTCLQHMNSTNMTEVVEACLNETLTREYHLTVKVFKLMCDEYQEEIKMDASDYIFGVVLLVLLVLNILGSLYDFCDQKKTIGSRFLLCFSVRHSWGRLAAPSNHNQMQRRIRVIYSLRTITALLVVLAHSILPSMLMSNNPQFIEETYHNLFDQILYNGTLIVQTFFSITGILLAYNFLLSEEKRPPNWKNFPKAVLLRWIRLTPVYALVTFYVMTWARHFSVGPFHQQAVTSEALACQRDWWLHMLYIHNYKDHSSCMIHCWYLAADFQLSVVGLLIFCLLYSNRSRKIAISVVIALGLITPAVHTFVQDLNAVLIVSPEMVLNFFVEDPTFNNLYKRGHTNLVCFGLGLAMAYVFYNLKESDLGAKEFKKYRLLYWLLFPLMALTSATGAVFYMDGIVVPLAVRAVYSSVIKLIFGSLTLLFTFFTIVKVEGAFRGVLHWGGWARISRLTYLVYLVHVPVLRAAIANTDELIPAGNLWIIQNYLSCLATSFLLAVPLFILVEAPLTELVKVVMFPAPRPKIKPVITVGHIVARNDTLVTVEDLKAGKQSLEVKA